MLAVAVPLQLAAQSLAWSAGAWRLHGKRDLPALRWAAPILTILLIVGWILAGLESGRAAIPFWLWPNAFPIEAGLGLPCRPVWC
jgi:hypothetical protein